MSGRRRAEPTGEGVELLDSAPHSTAPLAEPVARPVDPADGASTTVGGSGRVPRFLAGLAALAILALLLALSRSDPTEQQAVVPVDSTQPSDPGTTIVDRDDPVPTISVPATTVASTTLVPGQYLLGSPTGYWLFFGGTEPLQRLDLDNGERVQFGIRAEPVLVVGRQIVLYQAASETIGWVEIDDPGQQVLTWKRGRARPGDEPSQLWVHETTAEGGRWTLFDVDSSAVLERRPARGGELGPGDRSAAAAGWVRSQMFGPDLMWRSDGIHRLDGDEYRRVDDGRLLAHDAERALVESCVADGECGLRWVDRASWSDLPLVPPSGDVAAAELVAGGRWLRTIDDRGRQTLHLVETELPLPLGEGAVATISPDGRWLAIDEPGDGTIGTTTIIDLSTGEPRAVVANVGWSSGSGGNGLLFVPKPSVGPEA